MQAKGLVSSDPGRSVLALRGILLFFNAWARHRDHLEGDPPVTNRSAGDTSPGADNIPTEREGAIAMGLAILPTG